MSLRIANFIRENNDRASSLDVLMFSLTIALNTLFIIIVVLGFGAVTGRFTEAVLTLFGFVLLRFFSGGFHLSTSGRCNLFSILTFCILMHLPIAYWNWGFVLNGVSLLLALIYAPTKDIMALNRLGPEYTLHFKIVTMVIIAANFWIQSPALALAFITQSISLTPIAYKAAALLERR